MDGVANLNAIDFQGNQWYEVQMQIKRNGATGNPATKGFSKLWINSLLDADSLASWAYLSGMGGNDLNSSQDWTIGLPYSENSKGHPLTCYVDDVGIADGWIEPTT